MFTDQLVNKLVERLETGEIRVVTRDLTQPSPLATWALGQLTIRMFDQPLMTAKSWVSVS